MKYLDLEGLKYLCELIKGKLGTKVDATGGDISDTVIGSAENVSEEFPIPAAGEGVKTFAGKVRKNLEDWKNFKAGIITLGKLVKNGQCEEPGFALDARYGKTRRQTSGQGVPACRH